MGALVEGLRSLGADATAAAMTARSSGNFEARISQKTAQQEWGKSEDLMENGMKGRGRRSEKLCWRMICLTDDYGICQYK
jgi:hypothetical protein